MKPLAAAHKDRDRTDRPAFTLPAIWLAGRLWPALKAACQGWARNDGAVLSAAMAYYTALSLLPLLLLLISGVGFLLRYSGGAQFQQQQLIESISTNVSPWLAEQITRIMADVQLEADVGAPLGLVTLIIAAIGIFTQLQTMVDRASGQPPPSSTFWQSLRTAVVERLVAFLMLMGVGVLLTCIFVADKVLSQIQSSVAAVSCGRTCWNVVQTIVTTLVYSVLLGLIYRLFHRTPIRWRDALAGGLLAGIVWRAGESILETLVIGAHYSAQGVVGSLIAVMLWMYYASAVVFLGANFVHAMRDTSRP